MAHWERSCSATQESDFTLGKHGCGTVLVCPEEMVELGPEVWKPVKVLGNPVGSRRFVEEVVQKRLEEEHKLLEAIPPVLDLQAAWQILLHCAGPRWHHMKRTLPPTQSEECAR